MAAERTAPAFLDQLRGSGLLSDAQLDELAQSPEARDDAPTALARAVYRRGWLTRFQLNAIAAGRAKDLCVGPYVVLDRLGEGGMGMVYKARHQHMRRVVALKVIRKEKLAHPEAVKRFYQEVQLAASLHHPNIVLAYDAGPAGATHYFAMEYVEGVDLARLVKERGPLPVAQACEYVRQAALGLQHAHEKGLVHRDVKPHNLLVSRPPAATEVSTTTAVPRGDVVKLLDLGLARLQGGGDTGVTRVGVVLGTPDYLAPEQAINSKTVDVRADLYSLGGTLYYLLTGQPPFTGGELTEVLLKHQMERPASLAERGVDVPPGVQAILDRLLAKKPEDRYQTPAELAEAIATFCREGTLTAGPFDFAARGESADDGEWGPQTLMGEKGRTGRALVGVSTVDLSRTGAGARLGRKKAGRTDGEETDDEASGRKILLWALVGAGAAVPVLALVLLAGVLFWRSRHPPTEVQPPEPPAPEEVVKRPVVPPDGGKPAPPPDGGGDPAQPPRGGNREVITLPGWGQVIDPDGDCKVVPQGLALLIEVPPTPHDLSAELGQLNAPRVLQDVEGDFSAQVKVCGALRPTGPGSVPNRVAYHAGGLLLWGDDRNYVRLERSATNRAGALRWFARLEVRTTDQPPRGEASEMTEQDAFLRLERRGNRLTGSVSTDGREWTALPPRDAPLPAKLRVGVAAVNAARQPLSVRYEDFRVGPPVASYPPPTADPGKVLALPQPIMATAFAPDGKALAVVGTRPHLWDPEGNKELPREFGGPRYARLHAVAWSADGRRLLVGGERRTDGQTSGLATLYEADTGKLVAAFEGHPTTVRAVALSPDGKVVLTAGGEPRRDENGQPVRGPDGKPAYQDTEVRRWDAATGKELGRHRGPIAPVHSLAFGNGGSTVLATLGAPDAAAYVWEADKEQGRRLPIVMGLRNSPVLAPDGHALAYLGTDWSWHLLDPTTGQELRRSDRIPLPPVQLSWSRDGRYLACGALRSNTPGEANRYAVYLTETATGRVVWSAEEPTNTYGSLSVADDGGAVFSNTPPRGALLWTLRKPDPAKPAPDKPAPAAAKPPSFLGHDGDVLCVAFSPDGTKLVSGGSDQTVRVWDAATGKELKKFQRPLGTPIRVGFAGKGTQVVMAGDKGYQSWDIEAARMIRGFLYEQRGVRALSPDGELVLLPKVDGHVFARKTTDTGRHDHIWSGKLWGNAVAGAFSPDGRYAVFATNGDGRIHVADLTSDKEVGAGFVGPRGEIYCLAVAPKLTYVLTADEKGVELWSMQTLKPIRRFVGHTGRVPCAAFAPDGKSIVTGGADGTVRLWDPAAGKELHQWAEHKGPLHDVAFSPDGKSVVACGSDGIKLWEVPKPPAKP